MRVEILRLYRHLIIGGVIIVACCYAIMEIAQIKFSASHAEQLLCADAEISSALLLSGVNQELSGSEFDWTLHSKKSLPASLISPLIAQKSWFELPSHSYRLVFGSSDKPLLTGVVDRQDRLFQFGPLLERLLLTDKITYQDKLSLLENMSCISIEFLSFKESQPLTDVGLVYSAYGQYGFLWKDESHDDVIHLSVVQKNGISLSVVVALIVSFGIIVMLLLIWRELISLDFKRQTFESIMRQIAQGRSGSGLSENIPDSSGTLKELAYSFDSMSSHIERLLKVQREMTNAISHELRTPIARLRFGLEVMKDEVDDSVGPTIEALEGDVEELNTLVDEVLTYGKLESGSMELNFSKLSIYELVNSILENNHLLLQHLTVDVNISETSIVLADEHHLIRALQNLILNASKYATSNITISFYDNSNRWQLDVEDDGPGIAFEDRDKVFVPFQRLDNSRARASGGYGLGLAIVQRIAFWHGGAVLIDSSESGGAKFSLIWSRDQHQKTLS
ncbi:histidine kinase [Marinomonas ushuaiensis DSM 15871]|uniref:histidine kinase n=1 Tax=Marinomonas ushuaiensis DSM 15871 TaxID=1122207 RepID=X7E463_9GAMM|nr:ATP-binding protein [Marinomonas ushuaiensis]ETX10849.1 histidine kinase [Marinomonas ushuaiensis DSM 15871]